MTRNRSTAVLAGVMLAAGVGLTAAPSQAAADSQGERQLPVDLSATVPDRPQSLPADVAQRGRGPKCLGLRRR
jgi:hypothetical protein